MTVATIPAGPVRGVLRVLVVGPTSETLRTVRRKLREIECAHVLNARSAEDAVAQINSGRIDALVVDRDMWADPETGIAESVRRCPGVGVLTDGEATAGASALDGDALRDRETLEAALVGAVSEARAKRRKDTMVRWLERESCTDMMTGLLNRRGLGEFFRAADSKPSQPVGILLMNVVGTGMVNHNYGTEAGDRMIRRAARGIVHCVRGSDVLGRIEGDTFAIVLANADVDTCRRVARRIAHELERMNLEDTTGDIPVSVTFGLACGTGVPAEHLVSLAKEQIREQRRFVPMPRMSLRPSDGPYVA